MVGDRYFTDVLFGNRHGLLTVRVEPLLGSGAAEPLAVRAARAVERSLVAMWRRGGGAGGEPGLCATPHPLLGDDGDGSVQNPRFVMPAEGPPPAG